MQIGLWIMAHVETGAAGVFVSGHIALILCITRHTWVSRAKLWAFYGAFKTIYLFCAIFGQISFSFYNHGLAIFG